LASRVITLDSSGLFTLLNRRDPDHERARAALGAAGAPYLVPASILTEIAYLIEQRMPTAMDPFLGDLEDRAYSIDCGDTDMPRIRELVKRYADLGLGLADAAVIACAERRGGAALTFDRRDFDVVAREGTIHVRPV
jgi:predicted nucleic acid-binding protein